MFRRPALWLLRCESHAFLVHLLAFAVLSRQFERYYWKFWSALSDANAAPHLFDFEKTVKCVSLLPQGQRTERNAVLVLFSFLLYVRACKLCYCLLHLPGLLESTLMSNSPPTDCDVSLNLAGEPQSAIPESDSKLWLVTAILQLLKTDKQYYWHLYGHESRVERYVTFPQCLRWPALNSRLYLINQLNSAYLSCTVNGKRTCCRWCHEASLVRQT